MDSHPPKQTDLRDQKDHLDVRHDPVDQHETEGVADRTAGLFAKYALKTSLTPAEERAWVERAVAGRGRGLACRRSHRSSPQAMKPRAVLDTNVLLRHLLQDIPDHSARASELFRTIRTGSVGVFIADTVAFEAVYILEKRIGIPRRHIAEVLTEVLTFAGVTYQNTSVLVSGLAFWARNGSLSFADCHYLALTAELGLTEIYSFDEMDRYPGVARIEP